MGKTKRQIQAENRYFHGHSMCRGKPPKILKALHQARKPVLTRENATVSEATVVEAEVVTEAKPQATSLANFFLGKKIEQVKPAQSARQIHAQKMKAFGLRMKKTNGIKKRQVLAKSV